MSIALNKNPINQNCSFTDFKISSTICVRSVNMDTYPLPPKTASSISIDLKSSFGQKFEVCEIKNYQTTGIYKFLRLTEHFSSVVPIL